ncbi:MAG TPA: 5'-deoxynucleotidase [Clostridiales bacterium]|nr:5'-deoxynucleotidase [Clostridiales bacterium]
MENGFFAMMSRMKLIERWALMRNSNSENISEHSLEVSILAHALAIISNERLGNHLNAEKAALIGLYHDATEIITGDMPTPIKYFNENIQGAFKAIEADAARRLLGMLPEDMRAGYESIFFPKEGEAYLWRLVKAADKLSALIKCIEERKAGNTEFGSAEKSLCVILEKMELAEVDIFTRDFLPAYEKTLDELNGHD